MKIPLVLATAGVSAFFLVSAIGFAAPPEQQQMQQTPQMQQMWARVKTMQNQMARIHQTTDPREREKLMQEHMQTMQAQMQAMQAMGGGMMQGMMDHGSMGGGMMKGQHSTMGPAEREQMMQDRMDMMQMMMQQMMEHMQQMRGQ